MTKPPFWQVGLVVQNIEEAQEELTRALGVEWCEIAELSNEWDYRLVLSRQGPPYIELLEGPPGSPWDATQGSRMDHFAIWTDDVAAERRRLEAAGLPVDWDGQALGRPVNYHSAPQCGIRIETVDSSMKANLSERFGLEDMG